MGRPGPVLIFKFLPKKPRLALPAWVFSPHLFNGGTPPLWVGGDAREKGGAGLRPAPPGPLWWHPPPFGGGRQKIKTGPPGPPAAARRALLGAGVARSQQTETQMLLS